MTDNSMLSDAARDSIDVDAVIREGRLELNGFDAYAIGHALRMDDRKIRMGLAILAGMEYSPAALAAGYSGNPKSGTFRSAASRKANSKQMKRFLQAAREFKAGLPERDLTDDDKLRELALLSRAGNPQLRIRAIEAHTALQEKMGRRRTAPVNEKPAEILRQIAAISPMCAFVAQELARVHRVTDYHCQDATALPRSAEFAELASIRHELTNEQRPSSVHVGAGAISPAVDGAQHPFFCEHVPR